MQELEDNFRAQVAVCRRTLLDKLKDSFLSIGKNRIRVDFESLRRNLPEIEKNQLAKQYEDVVKWCNESMTRALQKGF